MRGLEKTYTDSAIYVLWDTIRWSQSNQFVNFRAFPNTESVVHACCRIRETVHFAGGFFAQEIYALKRVSLQNSISCHSQVMFWAFCLTRVLINRLDIRWFQWKVSYSKTYLTIGLRAQSRNLGGRCLKRYRQKFEGDGKAWLNLFQRRVLLEMLDQKQSFHLT